MGGSDAWSECGNWHYVSKCALMLVMFVGRLRGLPSSIEPTVRFEFDEEYVHSSKDPESVQRAESDAISGEATDGTEDVERSTPYTPKPKQLGLLLRRPETADAATQA